MGCVHGDSGPDGFDDSESYGIVRRDFFQTAEYQRVMGDYHVRAYPDGFVDELRRAIETDEYAVHLLGG